MFKCMQHTQQERCVCTPWVCKQVGVLNTRNFLQCAAVLHLTSKGALNTEAPSGGEEIEH